VHDSDKGKPSFARSFSGDGALRRDVRDGYGPEAFVIDGRPGSRSYHVWVHYAAQAMMGYGFGQVQAIVYDGSGAIAVETRPFVVMNEGAYVDLGFVTLGGKG